MSGHWRMALENAAWIVALAISAGAVVFYVSGGVYAGSLLYGVGVGLVSLVSTAGTISLLTQRRRVWRVIGVASFVARYGFAVAALGVPAYLSLWPAGVMLCGFAGVYLAENVVLLPRMMMVLGDQSVESNAARSVAEEVERRAEA